VSDPYAQVSSVYKAIKALADNVPQAPLRVYRRSDDQIDDKSPKAKEIKKLFENPNPLMTGNDFVQYLVGFFALFGEAFIVKDFGETATLGELKGLVLPKEIWTFKPTSFVEKVENGMLVGWKRGGATEYDLSEVVLMRDFNPSSFIRGLAPTSPILKNIDIDYKALIYNSAFFENFARLGTVLTTDSNLTDAQWSRITAYVDKQHKGASKSFKSAVFEGGLKPTTVGETHKDMEFIAQAQFNREEILGIWRVPKAMFNITDGINYATFMGQMRIFWLYALMPIMRKIEDALNERIVKPFAPDLYVEFDLTNVPAFQEDLHEKVKTAQTLFNMGVPLNEINARLGLGFHEIPNGDVSWLPMNLIPSGSSRTYSNEEEEKAVVKVVDRAEEKTTELQTRVWKGFIQHHDQAEKKIKSRASKYLWEQRDRVIKRVLNKSVTKDVIRLDIDWQAEKDFLKRDFSPVIYDAIRMGADFAQSMTHRDIEQAILEGRLRSFLTVKIETLTRVEDWLKSRIELNIEQGLSQGLTNDEIARNLKQFYNDVKPHWTQRIARTEATSALNGGTYTYLEEAGAKTKTWIAAIDEFTRDSHRHQNGMTIKFTDRFPNGLMYPADDGDPAEICNCRCTLITQDL
jgi:HK97 family phage portal protein